MLAKTLVCQSAKINILLFGIILSIFITGREACSSGVGVNNNIEVGILFNDFDGMGGLDPKIFGGEFYVNVRIDQNGEIFVPGNIDEFRDFIKIALGEDYYNLIMGDFPGFYCYPVEQGARNIAIFSRFVEYLSFVWAVDDPLSRVNKIKNSGYSFFEAGAQASKILTLIASANGFEIQKNSHGTDFCYNVEVINKKLRRRSTN